jgi:VIT1/CCC1 family predicted Fe2+/Mn2+ transporter
MTHKERHHLHRSGWLRAAVLGANDGIVSTASLMLGVAASHAEGHAVVVAGAAALTAGACSMAAGEYISVSSQADTEKADLDMEAKALATNTEEEKRELAQIYVERGLDPGLAAEVARQLMRKDALAAHARDELGLTDTLAARPYQAAWASAASFVTGAAVPVAAAALLPAPMLIRGLGGISLACLAALGATAAKAGGAPMLGGTLRVLLWGLLAMAITTGVGALFGVAG